MSESDSATPNSALFEPEEEVEGWVTDGLHPALQQLHYFRHSTRPKFALVEGVLYLDSLALLFGPPGAGKTFFALDLALHIATGKSYRGLEVEKLRVGETGVAYVVGESPGSVLERVTAWCDRYGIEEKDVGFYPWSNQVSPLDLSEPDSVTEFIGALKNACEYWNLIVIDTLARCFGDGDENSTRDMGAVVCALDRIKTETGACVLVIHHTSKSDTNAARGSNAMKGALDTEIKLKPCGGGFVASCAKQKDGEPFEPLKFKLEGCSVDLGVEVHESAVAVPYSEPTTNTPPAGRITENRAAAIKAVEEIWQGSRDGKVELTVKEFNRRLSIIKPGIAKGSASATLKWMVEQNYLRRPNDAQIEIGSAFEPPE